jgi:hypothetical protein
MIFQDQRYTPLVNELKNMALVFNGVSSRGLSKAYGYGILKKEQLKNILGNISLL